VIPPVAFTVALYEVLTVAAGNDVVVMVRVPITITMLSPADWILCVGVCESVTITVKLAVPPDVPVGVPESTPVEGLIESHDGLPLRLQV
jgi:hypothetical protein